MKKFVAILSLVSFLFVGTQITYERSAKAVLVAAAAVVLFGHPEHHAPDPDAAIFGSVLLIGACILLFPICLLDQKGQAAPMTDKLLTDNGYTPQEAQTIMTEMNQTAQLAGETKTEIKITPEMTRADLATRLRAINPAISNLTVSGLADVSGVQ